MDAVDSTMEKLRAQCLSRGASGIQGVARFFRRLDRDGSRSLDVGELQRGLAELGLVLDAAEMEGVCRRWDRDGSGTLDLEEFLRALRSPPHPPQPPMSQAREAVIAAAFAKLDRSGDGVVTVDDLRGIYSGRTHPKVQSGEWTEEQVLRHFLDNFDSSEKDGQVTLAEFQDYYSGVSASVDTDEEFVAMMTSAWRLEPCLPAPLPCHGSPGSQAAPGGEADSSCVKPATASLGRQPFWVTCSGSSRVCF
ncbi:calcyphosin isoform X3 [Moschus berezovskii]|uniref:calcyphosin isoform X3 n=1 Tax=Moschus berezovskii TaxID=68408 RepID=UPI002444B795|nr:calcyphosin isoform X3 [Moschus berezovskii]